MSESIDIPEEERRKLLSVLEKMLEMGIGAVYGDEEDGLPDAFIDCGAFLSECRSICCTFNFALTKDEVKSGRFSYNPKRPFFIARDDDGYCSHLDRSSLGCIIHAVRPLRCRRYNCGRTNGKGHEKGPEP